jgi:hypothetical protein
MPKQSAAVMAAPQTLAACEALARKLVTSSESRSEFNMLYGELTEQYSPDGEEERFLLETLITDEWHLRRINSLKPDLLNAAMADAGLMASVWADTDSVDKALERLMAAVPASKYGKAVRQMRRLEKKLKSAAEHVRRQLNRARALRRMGPGAQQE